MTTPSTTDREIVLSRIICAPRQRVWNAFTDPAALEQWWGPNGFTITTQSIDVRIGGGWKFVMHGPDGRDYDNFIRFTELVEPERMSHDHGSSEDDIHFQAFITFEDAENGSTKVTMRSIFPTKEALEHVVKNYGAIEGGKQTLGRLAEFVE